jgi:hypothetical protein
MSIATDFNVGLEEIATSAFSVLHGALNAELAQIEAAKVVADAQLDEMRGRVPVPVTLEPVERGNFHLGHIPSLIEDDTPLDSYPNVSVMAYRAQPAAFSPLQDQATTYVDSLYVEVLVKAGPMDRSEPYRQAEICDKRIWRTAEAVVAVLLRNPTLGGTIAGLEDPTVIISEVFTRPQSDSNTEIDWFWQAGRVEFAISKFSPFE